MASPPTPWAYHLCKLLLLNDMQVQQREKSSNSQTCPFPNSGAVATGEDPTSVAIASIQSAATFPDPNVKYVFRTENGGQVREGARWLQVLPGVGIEGGN